MKKEYCKCFCEFDNGKAFTGFVVITDNKPIIIQKNKEFEAINSYEAFIKIANRMTLKLEEEYDKYILVFFARTF